jgi:hypothetical protein
MKVHRPVLLASLVFMAAASPVRAADANEVEGWTLSQENPVKKLTPQDDMRFKAAQTLAYTPLSQLRTLSLKGIIRGPQTAARRGIKELEKFLGPTDPGLLVLWKLLAEINEKEGSFSEAEDARIKLLLIREDSQGKESAGVADARADLADCYFKFGKDLSEKKSYRDARVTFEKGMESYTIAISLYERLFGTSCPKIPPLKQKLEECRKAKLEVPSKNASIPRN